MADIRNEQIDLTTSATSLGVATATQLTVDNIQLDGNNIESTSGNLSFRGDAGSNLLLIGDAGDVNILPDQRLHIGNTPTFDSTRISIVGGGSITDGPNIAYINSPGTSYPTRQDVNLSHDWIEIYFDAYTSTGTNQLSSDAGSNYKIEKRNDLFKIQYDSGIAQGAAITWNDGFQLDTSGQVTLQDLQIDNININGNIIESTTGDLNLQTDSSGGVFRVINAESNQLSFQNLKEEDIDAGRETIFNFTGEQSGGESSTLARIRIEHEGAADDQQGKMLFYTNAGSDGGSPQTSLIINSDGQLQIPRGVDVSTTLNGYLMLGITTSTNIVIDDNEILARDNGSANTALYLQQDDGFLHAQPVYDNTVAASANVNVGTDGHLQRATCGEIYKKDIQSLTIDTSGVYDLDIKTFKEKNGADSWQHSIIANSQSYNALPEAVIKSYAIIHKATNEVIKPIGNPNDYELRYEAIEVGGEKKNIIWGGSKRRVIRELPNPIAEYEIREIEDSLNWNVITTAILIEMRNLRDRIIALET
jgi:hypothetical protein